MADALDLGRLKLERTLRRMNLLVLLEAFGIVALVGALSLEYSANDFMREWVQQNAWPVGFLLNGTLVGVLAGLVGGWVLATVWLRKSREQAVLDRLRKVV